MCLAPKQGVRWDRLLDVNRIEGAAMSLHSTLNPGNSMRLNVVIRFADPAKKVNWVCVVHDPLEHLEDVFLCLKDLGFFV